MNILTVNLLLTTIVFGIAAQLYLVPGLPVLDTRAVSNALRHFSLMFLSRGAVSPGFPRGFVMPGASGDLLAVLLALVAFYALVKGLRSARVQV